MNVNPPSHTNTHTHLSSPPETGALLISYSHSPGAQIASYVRVKIAAL